MPGIETVAVIGLLLAWIGVLWLPLMVARLLRNSGATRLWAGAGLLAYAAVVLGYTATIAADATETQETAWSAAWIAPLVLSLLARRDPGAVWRKADLWLAVIACVSFVAVFPFLPVIFLAASIAIWG